MTPEEIKKHAWRQGDKLTVQRSKVGGGTEKVVVEFDAHIPNENRFWAYYGEGDARQRIRVGYGKVVPETEFKKDAIKDKKVADVIPDELKSDAKVETEIKEKKADLPQAPAPEKKPTVSDKETPKVSKTSLVIAALGEGKTSKQIKEEIGCDQAIISAWSRIFTALDEGAKIEDVASNSKYGYKSQSSIQKNYTIYQSIKGGK